MSELFELPPEFKSYFPSHGWIEGKTGMRHLRFPILRVFQPDHPAYSILLEQGLAGVWIQMRSPHRTLRQLGVALRDLHSELRLLLTITEEEWLDKEISKERNQSLTRQREGLERCEVYLISIFILLRRLADEIMESVGPILFEHRKSVPKELKKAILLAESGRIGLLKPRCDSEALTSVLINNTRWLKMLREEEGIRDTLVHWPHMLSVNPSGTKPQGAEKFTWQISGALTTHTSKGLRSIDVFPKLVECLSGACEFMTSITNLIGDMVDFDRGDIMFLTGQDNDIVGFWPNIIGGQHEFPLLK